MQFSNVVKNFVKGMGNIVNIFPELPAHPFHQTSDADRLAADWKQVGSYLQNAMKQVIQEENLKLTANETSQKYQAMPSENENICR